MPAACVVFIGLLRIQLAIFHQAVGLYLLVSPTRVDCQYCDKGKEYQLHCELYTRVKGAEVRVPLDPLFGKSCKKI
jgi:hypothetical protein